MNYAQVKKIVNKHDPLGLIVDGAPQNEYNPEIMDILSRLKKNKVNEKIDRIIEDVFTEWFDQEIMSRSKKELHKIARDLKKL